MTVSFRETVKVGGGSAAQTRQVTGEIVVPPTSAGGVPVNSLTNLQQVGSQQAVADGEVARTEAQAALGAARQQRRLLGPAVATLGRQSTLWVRASVFASDVGAVRRGSEAMVRPLGSDRESRGRTRSVRPVQAPPSADSVAGTVDLYYAVHNDDRALRVGQRVAVELLLAGRTQGLSVPSSAIVRDIYGGEWVYRKTGAETFVRQRVEVASESGGQALLARGLKAGALVVTVGAAELFGTEFGAAH